MSNLPARPTSLAGWLDLQSEWLREQADQNSSWPAWDQVLVAEEVNGEAARDWRSAETFEERFQEIHRLATRSWVNLVADHLENRTLYVIVEYLTHSQSAVDIAPERMSINLSATHEFRTQLKSV
jgi:hypothetical protein